MCVSVTWTRTRLVEPGEPLPGHQVDGAPPGVRLPIPMVDGEPAMAVPTPAWTSTATGEVVKSRWTPRKIFVNRTVRVVVIGSAEPGQVAVVKVRYNTASVLPGSTVLIEAFNAPLTLGVA